MGTKEIFTVRRIHLFVRRIHLFMSMWLMLFIVYLIDIVLLTNSDFLRLWNLGILIWMLNLLFKWDWEI